MDLYGLPPEEFTAARDAAAKQDKALKALRKPSVSAWVVNTLVRHEPGLIDDLSALGASLAEAQQSGDGPRLRELSDQRRQRVASVTGRALVLVDRELSAAVRAEVEATLDAALADVPSAEAVRSGQLVRPLAFAGFGGVDLDGAVAPLPRVAPRASTPPRKDASAAEAKAHATAGALDDAVHRAEVLARALRTQEGEVREARAQEESAAGATTAARLALLEAEAAQKHAHRRRTTAEKEREGLLRKASGAREAVVQAQHEADAARQALDALRRS